jgi:hypothetical protein
MVKITNKLITSLREYRFLTKNTLYKDKVDEAITLFKDRKIEKLATLKNLLNRLTSRGLGPQNALKELNKYQNLPSIKGRLKREFAELNKPKYFFVSANIEWTSKTLIEKKNGKKYEYLDDEKHINKEDRTYLAKSAEEAKKMYMNEIYDDIETHEFDSYQMIYRSVNNVQFNTISSSSTFKPTDSKNLLLRDSKGANPKYDFIPEDRTNLKHDGYCVIDNFVSTYNNPNSKRRLKKMTREFFIQECYKTVYPRLEFNNKWTPENGVTPAMLFEICKKFDLTCYSFDVTRKCFLKNISTNRNYPAFVFYAINNHCYQVTDQQAVQSLVKSALEIETKLQTSVLKDDYEIHDIFTYTDKSGVIHENQILENIPINQLKDLSDNTIVIYQKQNLTDEVDQILALNIVPSVRNKKSVIIEITYDKRNKFNPKGKNITLQIDPSDDYSRSTWKDVKQTCKQMNIKFTNQSRAQLVREIKDKFLNEKYQRFTLTGAQRQEFLDSNNRCAICDKKVTLKTMQIDHILALANGGTNDLTNLQSLCKSCHLDKTKSENESGYVKLNETESSFNSIGKEIINSKLASSFAFVETYTKYMDMLEIDGFEYSTKFFNFDINNCRREILYTGNYSYPVFTVMDKPVIYQGQTSPGLYYIETNNYFPTRGNGWYYYPMVEYCLKNNIISREDVKFAFLSSLSVPGNYYNEFMDYLDKSDMPDQKFCINSMIGSFKPKERENWRSQCFVTDPNEAFQLFLEKKGNHIKTRQVSEDKTFYQVYTSSLTNTDETQCPIYQQIVQFEACRLHELAMRIHKKGGLIMHLNTDCVTAMFPDDINPFKCIRDEKTNKNNVKGFYYDIEHKRPMYKLEDKDNCPVTERLPNYTRKDVYNLNSEIWNVMNDVSDNNFKPLVDHILDNMMSINIDGLAGTGKSTLIKKLQDEMKIRGISFKSLAPTNKAARIIQGQTIHKFIRSHSKKGISEMATKYIFIDEISMVPEVFYKYFIVLHRIRPDIKFIIAGDFLQLEPVRDRVQCDYKFSPALFELCDGNRLQLSTCRRSDKKLFNLYHPDNVQSTKKSDFKRSNQISSDKLHLSFTNKKRKEINFKCMEEYKQMNKSKSIYVKRLSYDDNSQDMIIQKGTPLIARKGYDKLEIVNNETFIVDKVTDECIQTTCGKVIDRDQIACLFYTAFCITTHKAQGSTYDQPYMIHEWDKFTDRMKYVALSRATKYDHIYMI